MGARFYVLVLGIIKMSLSSPVSSILTRFKTGNISSYRDGRSVLLILECSDVCFDMFVEK